MEALDAEVALIVKAPNQQTADIKVRADTAWSVGELKAHLSEVYPSKPRTEEQKIIYSGRLLGDSAILKDVLRVYEGQETHTVHLVCAPRRCAAPARGGHDQRNRTEPTQENPPPAAPVTDTTDGLRRRNVAGDDATTDRPPDAPRPEMRQNDQNHTAEMQNFYSSVLGNYGRVPPGAHPALAAGFYPGPADPAAVADHITMMQQAYMQYMQQYANMWQTAGGNIPGVQPMNVVNEQPAQQPAAAPPAPPDAQDEDAEGAAPRDLLDWMYAISRLAILFSLLYFYSSPFRLALVMLLAALGYLYQLGFFREVGLDIRQNEQPRNEPQVRPADNRAPNEVRPADNGTDNEPTGPDAAANPTATAENANQQSYLAATWMIFSSFFTSLIPDTPNVV